MSRHLGAYEPGSPEWTAARAGRIGGSDIAAILGLSPWQSRFSLWHRMKGLAGPEVEKPEMTWGKRLEPVIVEAFAEAHPEFKVDYERNAQHAHPLRDWQVASPDALLSPADVGEWADGCPPNAGLEVKTDRFDDGFGEPGTDEIPVYYLAQCRWYLDVFGLDTWHVAALFSGSDYREYVVRRDDRDQALMREKALAFLATIEADERPDIDSHGATYQVIKELHPLIEPTDVELDAELVKAYCSARRFADESKAHLQHATSLVADAMGNAHRARFLGQTIADRRAKQGGVPYVQAGRNLPTFDDIEEAS